MEEERRCRFKKLDENRQRRKTALRRPIDMQQQSEHSSDTAKRSNISDISKIIQKSMRSLKVSATASIIHRTKSDVDEIASSVSVCVCVLLIWHRCQAFISLTILLL